MNAVVNMIHGGQPPFQADNETWQHWSCGSGIRDMKDAGVNGL